MKIDMKRIAAEAKATPRMPVPIPFFEPKKTGRNNNGSSKSKDDDDSTKYLSFDVRLDLEDKKSEKVTRKLKVFEDGTPEEYCKWRIDYDDLVSHPSFAKAGAKVYDRGTPHV